MATPFSSPRRQTGWAFVLVLRSGRQKVPQADGSDRKGPQNAHEDAPLSPSENQPTSACNAEHRWRKTGAIEAKARGCVVRRASQATGPTMARHSDSQSSFYDDEATRAMSEACVMAWRILEAGQTTICDERAATILRRNIAAAILELAASGIDRETLAHGAVDRIIAARRFRAG
jgi:hypothetical protein